MDNRNHAQAWQSGLPRGLVVVGLTVMSWALVVVVGSTVVGLFEFVAAAI